MKNTFYHPTEEHTLQISPASRLIDQVQIRYSYGQHQLCNDNQVLEPDGYIDIQWSLERRVLLKNIQYLDVALMK